MALEKNSSEGPREGVIRAVQTPLGFFTLAVLIVEGILGLIATKATGFDFTLLLISMIVLIILLIVIVTVITLKDKSALTRAEANPTEAILAKQHLDTSYDAFISSPMAGFASDDKYKSERIEIKRIVDCLQKECNLPKIFYAGDSILSKSEFEPESLSVGKDVQAIISSKYFILIYPQKIVSSVLFEAGYALAKGKFSIYFARNRAHLPFLLREAEQAFPHVKIYTYNTTDDIIKTLKTKKDKLFKL